MVPLEITYANKYELSLQSSYITSISELAYKDYFEDRSCLSDFEWLRGLYILKKNQVGFSIYLAIKIYSSSQELSSRRQIHQCCCCISHTSQSSSPNQPINHGHHFILYPAKCSGNKTQHCPRHRCYKILVYKRWIKSRGPRSSNEITTPI